MAAKKKTTAKTQETTLRHLWLASLGLAAVARRETLNAVNDAAAKVESFKKQAGKLANEAEANVRGGIASVREQGEAKVGQFSAEVEARLAPVLVKLGLKPNAGKAKRARKASKKIAAKRTRTPARKPAAKRAVRKTRA
ncbi:MAG TPA: hypothetical protein VIT22_06845 [Pseudoxanthomonas sp.]